MVYAAMGAREDETATRDAYIAIHIRIPVCLAPDMTHSERREAAAEEWVNDAGGMSSMSFGYFTNSMHEMADLWTEDSRSAARRARVHRCGARAAFSRLPRALVMPTTRTSCESAHLCHSA